MMNPPRRRTMGGAVPNKTGGPVYQPGGGLPAPMLSNNPAGQKTPMAGADAKRQAILNLKKKQ